MSYMAGALLEAGAVYTSRAHRLNPVFCGVRVAHIFSFLYCVVCFACHCLVSCVPNVAVHLDCPFLIVPSYFSNVYLSFYSFFQPIVYCLSFFDLYLRNTPLVSSNVSYFNCSE